MNELKGAFAIITGGGGGIGKATALAFAQEGAAGIAISDISMEKAELACGEVSNLTGCRCVPARTDVSSPKEIEELFGLVSNEFGRLDVLVNCAGICPVGTVEEIGEKEWDLAMDINLRGAYLCSREALRLMKPIRHGKIINLSSISGRIGGIATGINYAVSKGGLISMTMSLAKSAGPYNINVNAVAPGFIDTEMTRNFTHFKPETVPLGRIGKPEDVADVIVFLASERSRYVTGVVIDINGGVFMG